MAKRIDDRAFIGEGGIAVVQRILMQMRYAWLPTGAFDAGIDGYIELRDSQSKEMLGVHLAAQVKAKAKFTRETDTTFEYLCDQEDIDYWMRGNLPVLLIVVRSDGEDAWYKCVTEYFALREVRAARRVVFDKEHDAFDSSVANALRDLALPDDAGVPRQGLTGPETLLTNLLPLERCSEVLWSAPTDCYTGEQANARYAEAEGPRASDYLLRDGRLYSLRDPRTCELARICDADASEAEDIARWADSDDPDLQRRFADLLRRTLLQQLKPRIAWQPQRALFYFAATSDNDIKLRGSSHLRTVVAFDRYTGKDGEERISHIRHLAFAPRFARFDGNWYLQVTPDWYFSWDGHREDGKADERRRFYKGVERNNAVVNHLRFWEHMLTSRMDTFDSEGMPLRFGPLRREEVAVGIDDKEWEGARNRHAPKAAT